MRDYRILRLGFTPSSGDELQSEYLFPVEHAVDAISAVQRLHEQVSPHLLISEVRAIYADDFWIILVTSNHPLPFTLPGNLTGRRY